VGYNQGMPPDVPFSGGKRFHSYGAFLRERFGCRVHKVSVDAGFTCPNRDGRAGSGGCTYCDNDSFRPATADRSVELGEQIGNGIAFLRRRYRAKKFLVYFQPFTNTYAPLEILIPLYERALAQADVVGLSVGTRADCVDESKIRWFEGLARRTFVTLEYGLESIYNTTLQRINRGHDFRCFVDAVERTRGRGIHICAHVILGFPWESDEEILETPAVISRLGIHFLKLHQLHILGNTALGREFLHQPFRLRGLEEYVDLVVRFLERLSPEVRIERLSAAAPEDRLVGPKWGRSSAQVHRQIELELGRRNTWQGRLFEFRGQARVGHRLLPSRNSNSRCKSSSAMRPGGAHGA